MCKQIFLPIDSKPKHRRDANNNNTNTNTNTNNVITTNDKNQQPQAQAQPQSIPEFIHTMSEQFRTSVATSYYCIEHGLIRVPELFYCTQNELEQLEHDIIDNTVAPSDLRVLRGGHQNDALIPTSINKSISLRGISYDDIHHRRNDNTDDRTSSFLDRTAVLHNNVDHPNVTQGDDTAIQDTIQNRSLSSSPSPQEQLHIDNDLVVEDHEESGSSEQGTLMQQRIDL
jgi:hypothetical protein